MAPDLRPTYMLRSDGSKADAQNFFELVGGAVATQGNIPSRIPCLSILLAESGRSALVGHVAGVPRAGEQGNPIEPAWVVGRVSAAGPMAWGPEAWRAFLESLPALGTQAGEAGIRLLLRPHAEDVLSDTPRCLAALRALEGVPALGLVLDPVGSMTASMLPTAEDHLTRAFSLLGRRAGVAGIVLANVTPDGGAARGLREVGVDEGLIDGRLLRALVSAHAPAHLPLLVVGGEG